MTPLKAPGVTVSARTLWSIAGIAFLSMLTWVIGSQAVPEMVLVFGSIVIAEGARPPVEMLERRGFPRPLAILATLLVVLAVIGGLGWLIIAPVAVEVARLIDDLPHFMAMAQHELDAYQIFLHSNAQARSILAQLPSRISLFVESKLGLLVEAPLIMFALIKNTFLIILIAYFWLMASGQLATFIIGLVHSKYRGLTRVVLDEMSTKIGGYVRGVLINMVVIGVVSFVGVALLGIPYALLLGVVAALTESIPIVGPLLGGGVAVVVALLALGSTKALEVAALYLVIQQIEGNTLVPFVMNRVVALNPLTIIIALVLGTAVLGIPGAILSVPAAAIVQVLMLRIVVPAIRGRGLVETESLK